MKTARALASIGLVVSFTLLLTPTSLSAQTGAASLTGIVTDESGAADRPHRLQDGAGLARGNRRGPGRVSGAADRNRDRRRGHLRDDVAGAAAQRAEQRSAVAAAH